MGRTRRGALTRADTLGRTTLLHCGGLRVIEQGELDAQDAYKATRQRVWGLYLDELLVYDYDADTDGNFDAIDEQNGDKRCYCLQDFIYSTAAVTNSSGTVQERCDYSPYGTVTLWNAAYTGTWTDTHVHNAFLFTGQMCDPDTCLYHYKRRGYHGILGRFLQRDPEAYTYTATLYEYCASAPDRLLDFSGRIPTGTMTLALLEIIFPNPRCAFCGPDVTQWFREELALHTRYGKALSAYFLKVNAPGPPTVHALRDQAAKMTYGDVEFSRGTPCASQGCMHYVTLCGKCIHRSQLGNIAFGYAGRHFGFAALATFAFVAAEGRDPASDRQAYRVGIALAQHGTDAQSFCLRFLDLATKHNIKVRNGNEDRCYPCAAVYKGAHLLTEAEVAKMEQRERQQRQLVPFDPVF